MMTNEKGNCTQLGGSMNVPAQAEEEATLELHGRLRISAVRK